MNTNGIMEDIRNLLNEGKLSAEVIGLGYAKSSVYKAQRQLRKASDRTDQPVTQVLVTNMASEGWLELREENAKLRQQVSLLEEVTAERDTLREELELDRSSGDVGGGNQHLSPFLGPQWDRIFAFSSMRYCYNPFHRRLPFWMLRT